MKGDWVLGSTGIWVKTATYDGGYGQSISAGLRYGAIDIYDPAATSIAVESGCMINNMTGGEL